MARRYFGTDGVRGVVGEDLTSELVERLGRAATLWSQGGRVFIGRDTRGSGPELEEAFARGIVAAGGNAVLAGVLPTPAVALLALDLAAVISSSHNPPEYNGVKLFDREGQKLTDEAEEEIEALLDAPFQGPPGEIDHVGVATDSYLDHIVERFGSDLTGLRIVVDCANGAYSGIAPTAFERLGAEESGHIIYLRDHVTGDGLAAALLLCGALDGRTLEERAAVMPRFPQVKENIRVARKELPEALLEEVHRLNTGLDGHGRVLVRPSGTEPVIRV